MTWVLVLFMLQGQYLWPDRFDSREACDAEGSRILAGQTDLVLVDGYRCQELP